MANTISRGVKMNESFVMRCSAQDKAELKMAAAQQGTSVSNMIRRILIQGRYISPTSSDNFEV